MAVNQWFQRPDVCEFHRTQPQLNDRTSYVEPPSPHAGPNDRTDFQVGHARFNPENLPDFMYELDPPQEWLDYQSDHPPRQKIDSNGKLMWELHPRPGKPRRALLDFPHMKNIDKVCTYESWLWWEMNMRLDPHFRYEDGIMRMPMTGLRGRFATEAKFRNDINMRMSRGRRKWSMACWRDPRNGATGPRDKLLKTLSAHQIRNNTTRGSTPGLIDPSLGELDGNRIPIPAEKESRFAYWKARKSTSNAVRRARSSSGSDTEVSDYKKSLDGGEELGELSQIYTPKRRQLRSSQNLVNYADAEVSEDENSVGSKFEVIPERLSLHNETLDSEDDETTSAAHATRTKETTKRSHDPESSVAHSKKRKPNGDYERDNLMEFHLSRQRYPIGAVRAAQQINPPSRRREDSRRYRAAPRSTSSALSSQVHALPDYTAGFPTARSYIFDTASSTLMATDMLPTASHGATENVVDSSSRNVSASSGEPFSHHLHSTLSSSSSDGNSSNGPVQKVMISHHPQQSYRLRQSCPSQVMADSANLIAASSVHSQNAMPQGQAVFDTENTMHSPTQGSMGIDETNRVEQDISNRTSFFPDPASWCPEWRAFIIDHNAQPLLKVHLMDEHLWQNSVLH